MSPPRHKRSPTKTRSKKAGPEWVGGIGAMSAYVTGEGEPFQPEILVWVGNDLVLGMLTGRPGELLSSASESLASTMERPKVGPAHTPGRVRVDSEALAEVLRTGHPDLEVVVGPTPEAEIVLALMREHLGEWIPDERQSYLSPGMDPSAVGSVFEAAAALYRLTPWEQVPSDGHVFSVTIPALDVHEAALSVFGQAGESFGLALFSSLDDFESFAEDADEFLGDEFDDDGEFAGEFDDAFDDDFPSDLLGAGPCFALNFERGAELSPELRKEIAQHGWEVAGANAYPDLMGIDDEFVMRPTMSEDHTLAEVLARGLVEMLKRPEVLQNAWEQNEPVSQTITVNTHQGPIEITFRTPFLREIDLGDPSAILEQLAALALEDEIDHELREALEDHLLAHFAVSPEAKSVLDNRMLLPLVFGLAAIHLGATVPTLGPADLVEVLFEWIPRNASIDAKDARPLVEELRAFYLFLKRECSLPQVAGCLRKLGPGAVTKLEAALDDRSKFGMAKSLIAMGADAGFDVGSREGIEAFMRSIEGKPLPDSFPLLGSFPVDGPPMRKTPGNAKKSKSKAKRKRKAARKSKKKSR